MKGSLSLLKCSRSYWLPLDRHLSQSEIIARDKRRITCRRDSCRTSLASYKLNTMSSLLFVKHSFSYIQLERKNERNNILNFLSQIILLSTKNSKITKLSLQTRKLVFSFPSSPLRAKLVFLLMNVFLSVLFFNPCPSWNVLSVTASYFPSLLRQFSP